MFSLLWQARLLHCAPPLTWFKASLHRRHLATYILPLSIGTELTIFLNLAVYDDWYANASLCKSADFILRSTFISDTIDFIFWHISRFAAIPSTAGTRQILKFLFSLDRLQIRSYMHTLWNLGVINFPPSVYFIVLKILFLLILL